MCDQQCLRSACAYAQSDQSLCLSLEYSLTVKLLTEQHLEFLSLKGGCTGSSESAHVKMPHCWKSHVTAHYIIISLLFVDSILTKRAQGRKRFGMKNFKQRYFCLTNQMFAYSKCKGGIPLCVIPIDEILAVETLQEESFKMKYVS